MTELWPHSWGTDAEPCAEWHHSQTSTVVMILLQSNLLYLFYLCIKFSLFEYICNIYL